MDDVDVVYYLIHSMTAGKGFEESDERAATTVAEAAAHAVCGASSTSADCIRRREAVTPSALPRACRRDLPAVRRADARAAGGGRDRVGVGVVRDDPSPHRRAAVHAGAEVGAQPHPADRRTRRAALSARRRPSRRRREPRGRHRRTRRAALRTDDERLRGRGGSAAACDRRAARADSRSRLALGQPRDAGSPLDRPARSWRRCRTSAS